MGITVILHAFRFRPSGLDRNVFGTDRLRKLPAHYIYYMVKLEVVDMPVGRIARDPCRTRRLGGGHRLATIGETSERKASGFRRRWPRVNVSE